MWTINQVEQSSPFGGVSQMSHRDEPRSGRGCFGAVVVVPFLALGGMFALIALTGSPDEGPLAAPPPARPTSQWWTEPFETGSSMSTVTETVVVEGAAREVRAARLATQTRVAVSTVTETVRSTAGGKPPATGRNEPPAGPGEEEPTEVVPPSTSDSASPPVVTSSSALPPAPPVPPVVEPPASSSPTVPVTGTPTPSAPRSEDPVPPSTTPTTPAPPCERGEPLPSVPEEPAAPGEVSVGASVELPLPSPAEDSSTSSAPLAGV
ncbi:MAG: hypothetical protein QOF58_333 [Pseudonocardiales bacterium]|jgi:hypothetical protein|nr:hypothetical protein [Pseudonocardiales bacterium]